MLEKCDLIQMARDYLSIVPRIFMNTIPINTYIPELLLSLSFHCTWVLYISVAYLWKQDCDFSILGLLEVIRSDLLPLGCESKYCRFAYMGIQTSHTRVCDKTYVDEYFTDNFQSTYK